MDNKCTAIMGYHYMMQPGDGTLYRFGFNYYPADREEAYVLDSGVGPNAYRDYVKFYINMPGGVGLGVVSIGELSEFPEHTHIVGYLQGQGFSDTYPYTLVACLLALKVLVVNTQAIEEASKAMLQAQEIFIKMREEQNG